MEYFYVYILKCRDGSYYVGHTDNLEKRLSEHQANIYECHTSSRLPVELVFKQEFESRDAAFAIERKIKRWTRQKKSATLRYTLVSLGHSGRAGKIIFYIQTFIHSISRNFSHQIDKITKSARTEYPAKLSRSRMYRSMTNKIYSFLTKCSRKLR
jgi:putative endonuclease